MTAGSPEELEILLEDALLLHDATLPPTEPRLPCREELSTSRSVAVAGQQQRHVANDGERNECGGPGWLVAATGSSVFA